MAQFKIPVTWEMCGYVFVEADSVSDALMNFDPDAHELPTETSYVDGSFQLTSDDPATVKAMTDPPRHGKNCKETEG